MVTDNLTPCNVIEGPPIERITEALIAYGTPGAELPNGLSFHYTVEGDSRRQILLVRHVSQIEALGEPQQGCVVITVMTMFFTEMRITYDIGNRTG